MALSSGYLSWAQDTIQLDSTTLVTKTLVQSLTIPWDMNWGADGWIWFNERDGDIFRLHPDSLTLEKIYTIPDVFQSDDNSGSHAFALHPNFPYVPYAYAQYTTSLYDSKFVRFTYSPELKTFVDTMEIIHRIPANFTHNGSRVVFDTNNILYLCIGDGFVGEYTYDIDWFNGKVLRMTENGEIPDDNPWPGSYSYSIGHRNPQGLVFGRNGILYSSEHGDATDDEINIIEPGRNYGWPRVEGFCDSPSEMPACDSMNVREPLIVWTPTYAPGGLAYFDHPSIPEWRHSLLQVFLKKRRLTVLPLSEDGMSIVDMQKWDYLVDRYGRLREVLIAPNGRLFIATSNQEANGQWVTPDNYDKIVEIKNINYDYELFIPKFPVLASRVFPNPTTNGFWISVPNGGNKINVALSDYMGNTIVEKTLTSMFDGLWHFDTHTLQSGTYVLTYEGATANGSEKIVIVSN